PAVNGGLIYLFANGATGGGTSEITTEPPPTVSPLSPTGVTGKCTVDFEPPMDCSIMPSLVIAPRGTGNYSKPPSCSTGTLALDNPALTFIHVILNDDVTPCHSIDLRGLGNVDVLIEFGPNVHLRFDSGEGLFVQTGGNIWLKTNGNVFSITTPAADAGLPVQ